MHQRTLGKNGLTVSAIGLGCMGMSEFYGDTNEQQSTETIQRAYDLGITFFDTADIYGYGHNEKLVGNAVKKFRDNIVIATKCGIVRDPSDPHVRGINNTPTYIEACCDHSLQRLNIDYIDLYYLHRIDPTFPIEKSMEALVKLVNAGKIKHIGLSEANTDTIRRAHAIHPITAIQSEYSLWTRGPEKKVLKTCRELGIGFVPYSPLGRGFLSGNISKPNLLPDNDYRKYLPRFQQENIEKNLKMVAEIQQMAEEKNCSAAQLALAWVLAQGNDIVPIPGTKRIRYLEENIAAINVQLDHQDLARLNKIIPPNAAAGLRYDQSMLDIYGLDSE